MSIFDLLVKDRPGVYLAGGAIRSEFDGTKIDDYDLFFDSKARFSEMDAYLLSLGHAEKFRCPQGNLVTYDVTGNKVQLIGKLYNSSAAEIIQSFDFTASQLARDGSGQLFTGNGSMADAVNKILRLNRLTYPVATLKRIGKYMAKGYVPHKDFFFDLSNALAEIEPTSLNLERYFD